MNAEGWYVDPFGAHEARWFSNGSPTLLAPIVHENSQGRSRTIDRCPPGVCGAISTCRSSGGRD